MFERQILSNLKAWSESPNRKSLILRGARQVGKTTAVRMFGQSFETYIELNLEDETDRSMFISGTDVRAVLNVITLRKGIKQFPGRILIFIDEIQNSPEAMLSLRYFYEKMPELYIIAAGSLLEVYITRNRLPVSPGRVEYMWMYPCTFEEYLIAANQDRLLETIKTIPFPEYANTVLRDHFMQYALVGGMPEAIQVWLNSKNVLKVQHVLTDILLSYKEDAVKYAISLKQADILKFIIDGSYSEVAKQITFERFGGSDYKSQSIKSAFSLLEQASLVSLIYPHTSTELPAIPKRSRRPKLMFLDTGFINLQANIQADYFTATNLNSIYKGIAMEHLVGQQMIAMSKSRGFGMGFWIRNARGSSAEVDYVIIYKGRMIPVEVKSGKTGTLKSLMLFMDEAPHNFAVRIYDGVTCLEQHKTPSGKAFQLLNLNLGLTTRLIDYLDQYLN